MDDTAFLALRDVQRLPWKMIGVRVGSSVEAARERYKSIKARQGRQAAAAAKRASRTERRCLCGCGKPFLSTGAGNRISPRCRPAWENRSRSPFEPDALPTEAPEQ